MRLHTETCGKTNLYEEDRHGVKILKPHRLQVAEGVCAHENAEDWARLTAGLPPYYLGIYGDNDWPVHAFADVKPTVPDLGPRTDKPTRELKYNGPCTEPGCPRCGTPPEDVEAYWYRKPATEDIAHPDPEYAVMAGWPEGMKVPGGALSVSRTAQDAGWVVEVTYARGTGVHGGHGRPTGLRESVAVRMSGHPSGRRAVAVYERPVGPTGKWTISDVWVWGPDLLPLGILGVTDLKTFLADPAWLTEAGRKARVRAHALKVEQDKARVRTTAKRTVEHGG